MNIDRTIRMRGMGRRAAVSIVCALVLGVVASPGAMAQPNSKEMVEIAANAAGAFDFPKRADGSVSAGGAALKIYKLLSAAKNVCKCAPRLATGMLSPLTKTNNAQLDGLAFVDALYHNDCFGPEALTIGGPIISPEAANKQAQLQGRLTTTQLHQALTKLRA